MRLASLIFICLFSIRLFSQINLVPNSSFEDKNEKPRPGSNGGISLIKSWAGANSGPGDYYYRNNPDPSSSAPSNLFGNQEPHSGNAYTGICIEPDFIEYIEAQLIEPLVKGQEYRVSFFISKSDKRKSYVTEMGVLFLSKRKEHFIGNGIKLKPQIEFVDENGYRDEKNWIELSETYIADGSESVLIIGHFLQANSTGYKGKAHYYIDDVSIIKVAEEIGDTLKPNPEVIASNNSQIQNTNDTIRLEDLNFKFGTAILEGNYDSLLKEPIRFLQLHPDKKIKIEGHTDNIGNKISNLKLSRERAKAIADYMILMGINKNRLSYDGYGSTRPIADNNSIAGRHKNRRVELIIGH